MAVRQETGHAGGSMVSEKRPATPWTRGVTGEVDGRTHTVAVRSRDGRPECAACVYCGAVFAPQGDGTWTPVPEPVTAPPLWAYP